MISFVEEKNFFYELRKNNQNEYIESKGKIVDDILWGIGVKNWIKMPQNEKFQYF